jgi:hypothetical protein
MRRNPGRLPVAVTGCGNLGMNPGVLAWSEGWRGGVPGPVGGCLAIHASGRGHRATLDAPEDGDTWYVTGPDLVREGRPAVSPATTFADLRHLLLFPFVDPGEGPRLDFGYDHLLADPALCLRAAEGLVVDIPLRDTGAGGATVGGGPGREPLLEALGTKGYRASDHPGERGTYRLDRDRLAICFLEGIYPHHALALDAGGRPMSLLVGGLSNRAGVTVREFAEDLCGLGVEHAILLDNGGDVGLYLPRERRFVLRPAEPDRQELWPTTACLIWHR